MHTLLLWGTGKPQGKASEKLETHLMHLPPWSRNTKAQNSLRPIPNFGWLLNVPVPKTWPGRKFYDKVILVGTPGRSMTQYINAQCSSVLSSGKLPAHTSCMMPCLLGGSADGQIKPGGADKGVWIGKQLQEQSTCTNHRNRGRTSADRSTEATLMLTVPRSLIKSSTKDLTWPSLEIVFRQLVL